MSVEQTTATRNQSTAIISEANRVFIFDNRYVEGVFKNNTGADFELSHGQLVVRDVAVADGFLPATAANLANVIGVSAYEGKTTLAAGTTRNINIGTKGTINGLALVLPAEVTLLTTVGNKTLKDVLEGLGFHVDTSTVENTKLEN